MPLLDLIEEFSDMEPSQEEVASLISFLKHNSRSKRNISTLLMLYGDEKGRADLFRIFFGSIPDDDVEISDFEDEDEYNDRRQMDPFLGKIDEKYVPLHSKVREEAKAKRCTESFTEALQKLAGDVDTMVINILKERQEQSAFVENAIAIIDIEYPQSDNPLYHATYKPEPPQDNKPGCCVSLRRLMSNVQNLFKAERVKATGKEKTL
jgi:hypothetical protein